MQENNSDLWPIPPNSLEAIVGIAKKMRTYDDARKVLEELFREFWGIDNPEALKMIDSVREYFDEKEKQQYHEAISQQVDKAINKILMQNHIKASDETVAEAIYATAKFMSRKADWGALYRILVDFCDWPRAYNEFEERVQRLNLKLSPNIEFNYQSLTKGLKSTWPKNYRGWQTDTTNDPLLNQRRQLAAKFLENLKEQNSKEISNKQ